MRINILIATSAATISILTDTLIDKRTISITFFPCFVPIIASLTNAGVILRSCLWVQRSTALYFCYINYLSRYAWNASISLPSVVLKATAVVRTNVLLG